MKKNFKKIISFVLAAVLALSCTFALCGCSNKSDLKIGVLREDDTSGEASAWEEYLKSMGKELGFSVDFTTTSSSSEEVSAINTYASKGYNVIFLFSDDDVVAAVNAASSNKMYVVQPTGHPTSAQYAQIKDNEYYLGAIAPTSDTEYEAGYNMAKYFVEEKGQSKFTIFGGATLYGSDMHVQRLAGMLAYLCEDGTTSYDGVKTRANLASKLIGKSLDPSKFTSSKYKITGYMDGFSFDDAFSTKLTNSLEAGGTCILSVGAGGVVTQTAYGIKQSNNKINSIMVGGVDAIASEYAGYFDTGYEYDCGKFASAMAPALVLAIKAVNGNRLTDKDNNALSVGMSYWVATSKQELNDMLSSDNKKDGYCYNSNVINHFVEGDYEEFLKLCEADFDKAKALHSEYNK